MPKDKKFRYSVIKDNQLYIQTSSKNPPRLVKGQFRVDKSNSLIYLVNQHSAWQKNFKIPDRIKFKGAWRLNANHDLALDLEETKNVGKSKLVFKGVILDCRKDYLMFRLKSKQSPITTKISFLQLKGKWSADKFNRLIFKITKKRNPDILTFKNAWQLNKYQQITYKYQRLKIKRKHTITFKGFWMISSKKQLHYSLEHSNQATFNFKVHLQSPTVYPKQGKIKYRIGIGLGRKRKEQIIILYGLWKFSRRVGILFEIDYGSGNIKKMKFAARVHLDRKNLVIFTLEDNKGKPLGMKLAYKRMFLSNKEFEYFLKLNKERISQIGFRTNLHF